ncbi:MAG: RsmE family RNA methyltransferase [Elusimicrobiota bacterium]
MPQFFLKPGSVSGKSFHLKGPEAFHLAKVLRSRPGETITLFDGDGRRFDGLIEDIQPDGSVLGSILRKIGEPSAARKPRITLCPALLKPARWELVLEKGTELGVWAFSPLLTQRTLIPETAAEKKMERSSRVIMAAAKQCGVSRLPELRPPEHFRDAVRSRQDSISLLAWEALPGVCAASVLRPALERAVQARKPADIRVFIGPEGGWADEEVELAEAEGALLFGLGPSVLRAETASLAAICAVQYELAAIHDGFAAV